MGSAADLFRADVPLAVPTVSTLRDHFGMKGASVVPDSGFHVLRAGSEPARYLCFTL